MSIDALVRRAIKLEALKISILTIIFILGGVLFSIFIPRTNNLDWLHLFFYFLLGILVLIYFLLSSIKKIRRKKLALQEFTQTEAYIETTKNAPEKIRPPKGSVAVDQNAASYCPICNRSFPKTHQFCPNCGYCGIIKKMK